MKTTHYFKQLALLLSLSLITISCNNDDDGYDTPEEPQSTTITALASESDDLSILVSALQAAGLDSTLDSEGSFTVFAPTNAAFQALLDSKADWSGLGDIPLDVLINVLTYHVVPARAYDKDLAGALDSNNELPTAQGQNVMVDLSNLTINENSTIVGVNTNATNGVIHVIDNVLVPTL